MKMTTKERYNQTLRMVEEVLRREGVLSFSLLLRRIRGEQRLRKVLHFMESEGLIERIQKNTKARFYIRKGSFIEEPLDEDNVSAILAIITSRHPISRSTLARKTRFSAEKLDWLIQYLLRFGIIEERPGKKEYIKWLGKEAQGDVSSILAS